MRDARNRHLDCGAVQRRHTALAEEERLLCEGRIQYSIFGRCPTHDREAARTAMYVRTYGAGAAISRSELEA